MALQRNEIYQGDCVRQLAKLEKGSIDLVFADPPFNIGYDYDVYDDRQSTDAYLSWCQKWMKGIYDALKSDGTFWLAIGDEYAAELKIISQQIGFHCRSWVIWYYTFGVNCANGFSRSHTHLFHFVKDPKKFTFVRPNPNVRVKSARQLVYADLRANPNGRLPDNTWIIRPHDAPNAFRPNHDTWYYSRVAGTFKEREGFHGCQMPEQLLARIIRTSSHPYDLVLDPFSGSGTTLCVAKKLRRNWIGFELSEKYVKHIRQRLAKTNAGDPLDGPEDPIESAPQTTHGKKRSDSRFDEKTIQAVIESYKIAADGFPPDYLLCDKELNEKFVRECFKRGIGGTAVVWNRLMLNLRKKKAFPKATRRPATVGSHEFNQYGYASEVAWRLVSDEFQVPHAPPLSLDAILSCPDMAEYFDQIAALYGPSEPITSLQFRRAALSIRKMAKATRAVSERNLQIYLQAGLKTTELQELDETWDVPGVFLIDQTDQALFAGETEKLRPFLTTLFANNAWRKLGAGKVSLKTYRQADLAIRPFKSVLVREHKPLLNSPAWFSNSS